MTAHLIKVHFIQNESTNIWIALWDHTQSFDWCLSWHCFSVHEVPEVWELVYVVQYDHGYSNLEMKSLLGSLLEKELIRIINSNLNCSEYGLLILMSLQSKSLSRHSRMQAELDLFCDVSNAVHIWFCKPEMFTIHLMSFYLWLEGQNILGLHHARYFTSCFPYVLRLQVLRMQIMV